MEIPHLVFRFFKNLGAGLWAAGGGVALVQGRWWLPALLAGALVCAVSGGGSGGSAQAAPREMILRSSPLQVHDGDTFDADLDGNGQLDLPGERVRLLFVDTPELHESHKGQDLKKGLPARAFLSKALRHIPLRLEFPGPRRYDRFGRALAVVFAGAREINLELVRKGHSYFDTRFSFPHNYEQYAEAEGEAFAKHRGIWSTSGSRKKYLARLHKELKTPRAANNPLVVPGVQKVEGFSPERMVGKFVQVEGRLAGQKIFRNGARLLLLEGEGKNISAYVARSVGQKLETDYWQAGSRVVLDGFITLFRGKPQISLHYAALAGAPPRKGKHP